MHQAGRRSSTIPNEHAYTRVTEFKYLTGQEHAEDDASSTSTRRAEGDPYYPVPRPENAALYTQVRGARARRRRTCTSSAGWRPTATTTWIRSSRRRSTLYAKISGVATARAGAAHDRRHADVGSPLELWGGVECTVNRVGDRYFDQLDALGSRRARRTTSTGSPRSAFARCATRCCGSGWRPDGLAPCRLALERRAAGAAARARHPADRRPRAPRQRSARHRRCSIRGFPAGLAGLRRARSRERYPWVDDFTPVNEPLTTARFSGALRALVSARHATTASSSARCSPRCAARCWRCGPSARSRRTRGWSRPRTAAPRSARRRSRDQAEFENQRRWLDLRSAVRARSSAGHPLWRVADRGAASPRRSSAVFAGEPCPPDVVGLNYYLTSDRFLDERLDRYPPRRHGGNGRTATPTSRRCARARGHRRP